MDRDGTVQRCALKRRKRRAMRETDSYADEDKMFPCPNCDEYDLSPYGDDEHLINITCLNCGLCYIAYRKEDLLRKGEESEQ